MLQKKDRGYNKIGFNSLFTSIPAHTSDISGTTSATYGLQTLIVVLTTLKSSTTGTTSQIVNVITSLSKLRISTQ